MNILENDGDGPDLLKNDLTTADISLEHFDLHPYKNPRVEAVKTRCTALVQVSQQIENTATSRSHSSERRNGEMSPRLWS